MIRILHTSDWHLGRLFYDRSLFEDQEHVLKQIIELAGRLRPDAVLIAGDIYDRAIPSIDGVRLLDWVLSELVLGLKIPVFLISGNHDSGERLGFGARLMASDRQLRIVSSLPEMLKPLTLEDEHGRMEVFGIPYCDPSQARVEAQDEHIQGHQEAMSWCVSRILEHKRQPAIVLAHAYVVGGEGAESERPLSIGGKPFVKAETFGEFSYAALGHLHGRQSFAGGIVHYSGSLLPYHFSERETPKSVNVVEFDADRKPRVERIALHPRRKLVVVTGDYDEIIAQARSQPLPEDYVLVRRLYDRPRPDLVPLLRDHYPHLVNVEVVSRPESQQGPAGLRAAARRSTDLHELFSGFYGKMTPDPLSELQTRLLAEQLKAEQ